MEVRLSPCSVDNIFPFIQSPFRGSRMIEDVSGALIVTMLFDKFNDASRPTMAKAVSKPDIAMRAVIAVNILFRFVNFVNTTRPFQPFRMEIFPKRRCASIEHCAVIFLHQLDCKLFVARRYRR